MQLNTPLDASNSVHMSYLANELEKLPQKHWPMVCAYLTDTKLMKPQFWFSALLWVIRLRHRHTLLFWIKLQQRVPNELNRLVAGTADWTRRGKDVSSPNSAGGFNQDEVDSLQYLINEVKKIK